MRLFILMRMYYDYVERYYKKYGKDVQKPPLPFILWFLRIIGIILLIALVGYALGTLAGTTP